MSDATNTFDHVKAVILSAHSSSTTSEKVNFYNSWAENYDQVGWKCKTAKVFSLRCIETAFYFYHFHRGLEPFLFSYSSFKRMWPFWSTEHQLWQQTASPPISSAVVIKPSCWMSPVVQVWWPNRCIFKINKGEGVGGMQFQEL